MKPNDKAYQEAADEIRFNSGLDLNEDVCSELAKIAVDAAFAAQFPPSEDYAGLIEWLRNKAESLSEIYPPEAEAADALEAVLAERDALKAELAAGNEWIQARATTLEELAMVRSERDALLARLAPVDDKELVEIAADAIDVPLPSLTWEEREAVARAAIAAIRPHIEAAAYEAAARFIEENVFNYSSGDQNYWSHRKGDNTHGLEYAREFRARAAIEGVKEKKNG